jgi:uncharacterized protein (DUF111 family)
MAVMNQSLQDVVLQKIQEKPLRPTELIRNLSKEAYPREIENALSELIENGTVEFGSDGILRTTSALAHAS